ncbi:MAG: VCBS repeat-containing protein [bacterium]|nr:VCBS repeat-containing protein [bacterium]
MNASVIRVLSRFALAGTLAILAPLSALGAGAGVVVHEGSFAARDLAWERDRDGAAYPALPGLRGIDDPGSPRLPLQTLLLLVPADANVVDAWIEPLQTHAEKVPGPLARGEALFTDTGGKVLTKRLPDDGATYPAAWGRFAGTHTWRGYRLLAVEVYPLRQAGEGDEITLEFLDRYAVRVAYGATPPSDDMAIRGRLSAAEVKANNDMLARLVANPGELAGYRREHGVAVATPAGGFSPDKTPSLSGSAVEYLIITNEAMKPAFEVLAAHKTAQGLPTVVATHEFIEANYRQGADLQESVRMFIRDAYEKWGLEYVLLGGDSDVLPPRYVINSFYPISGSTAIPCDLYFACLDGSWNADGDHLYGEPVTATTTGDLADFAEEVYIGRAAVSTPEAATVFVNKVIGYEGVPAGAAWTNRALFAAEVLFPEDFQHEGYIILDGAKFAHEQIVNHIQPCTDMEYTRMYETDLQYPRDAGLTRAALVDTLDTGHYGIVNQIGHGYYFNMSVGDANFMTTDADNLTNAGRPFMIYALNCASAAFDNSCLLERFVQNPGGGAVCSIGSVRAAFPNNSNAYQQEFFSELYCTAENRVGRLLALSRLPFIGLTANNYVDRWTFENYTLLGDPTLPIWTGVPQAASVAAPASLAVGAQVLPVTVTVAGMPVAGARVCLQKAGEELAWGLTDGAGQVSLSVLPTSPGSATLTVTGRNLARYAATLPVVAGGAYLKVESAFIADNGVGGSDGNGDGFADAGETIAIWMVLRETGGVPATGLVGTVSCAQPGVTILVPTASFGSVLAGGTAPALTPLVVAIDPAVVDAATLVFTMDVAHGGGSSLSEWPLTVRAPELEVALLDWEDATWGDGDGMLEIGERLGVTVAVKNYGTGASGPVTGVLRTDSAFVTRYDSLATWATLGLLEEGTGGPAFSMAIDPSRNSAARIVLTDAHGRTLRHDFTLPRPDTPTGINTDTSLGADVIAISWAPSVATDIRGYHVYRSQSVDGPWTRANQDLVLGSSYFADTGLAQLTTYYYKVGGVDQSGVPSNLSAAVSRSTAPAEAPNFPAAFGGETSSPLAVGDVDGDGDLEIVVASNQVYVWHHSGLELLDGDNDSQTLGNFTDFAPGAVLQPAAVALADLDGEPGLEMIISERAPNYSIHVYTKTGEELAGWPRSLELPVARAWNWAAPAVGDIDGDGEPEIVVNTLNGTVWAWNADGSEVRDGDANPATSGVFYKRAGAEYEWSRSGPTLVDLDADGALDIVFGTKNDSSGLKRVMALKYDGSFVPGFPQVVDGGVNTDVVCGDLDGDGQLELVLYTTAGTVYALHANGTNYPGYPKSTGLASIPDWVTVPALGDINGDGFLEIVYAPNQSGLIGRLVALSTNHVAGTSGLFVPGWPATLPGSSEGSPVIGDIDGNGSPEILHGIGGGDAAAPYNLYAFHADGTSVPGFPITLSGPLMNGVTITDLDADGDVDIAYAGWDFLCHVWDMPFAYDRHAVPWPTFKGNVRRTGVYFPVQLVGVDDGPAVPAAALQLDRPYPNPFNPTTRFSLYVAARGDLQVDIYDVQGRRVRELHTGPIEAGWHTLVWDGRDDEGRGQASGVYLVRARAAGEASLQKMTLVK